MLKWLRNYRASWEISFRVLPRLKKGLIQWRSSFTISNARVGAEIEQTLYKLRGVKDDPDSWLKSCGAYAIGIFAIKPLEVELGKCLEHSDPLCANGSRRETSTGGTRRELLNLRGLMQIIHAPEPPPIRRKNLAPLRRQPSSGA